MVLLGVSMTLGEGVVDYSMLREMKDQAEFNSGSLRIPE